MTVHDRRRVAVRYVPARGTVQARWRVACPACGVIMYTAFSSQWREAVTYANEHVREGNPS